MTETLFGFPVQRDEEDELSTYSRNRLTNGDAESGNMGGWDFVDSEVVAGGKKIDSDYTFKVKSKTGSMEQEVPLGGAQPPDYKIRGIYLPEDVISDIKTHVQTYCKVEVTYAIGDEDIHYIPVMEPLAYKPAEDGGEDDGS
ncbi:hypothetical protein D3C79_669060 [compost metagenome]